MTSVQYHGITQFFLKPNTYTALYFLYTIDSLLSFPDNSDPEICPMRLLPKSFFI